MLDIIVDINSAVNNFIWGPVMLALLVGTGVFLTFRTGWIQVRKFGYIMKNTIGSLFRKTEKDHGIRRYNLMHYSGCQYVYFTDRKTEG